MIAPGLRVLGLLYGGDNYCDSGGSLLVFILAQEEARQDVANGLLMFYQQTSKNARPRCRVT